MKYKINIMIIFLISFINIAYSQYIWEKAEIQSGKGLCIHNFNNIIVSGLETKGVAISADYGNTWIINNKGLPKTSVISIKIINEDLIFAGTKDSGLYKSTDLGVNWFKIKEGLKNEFVSINSIGLKGNSELYIGSSDFGLYKSIDSGNTWSFINTLSSEAEIKSIAFDKLNRIYIGKTCGLYYSDDGINWNNSNLGNGACIFVTNLACDNDNNIYAGTGKGIYKNSRVLDEWINFENGLVNSNCYSLISNEYNQLYVSSVDGNVFYTNTNQNNWNLLGELGTRAYSLAYCNNGKIFATTSNGIYYTDTPSDVLQESSNSDNLCEYYIKKIEYKNGNIELTIISNITANVKYNIFNLFGYNFNNNDSNLSLQKGENCINLNFNNYSNGIYFIRFESEINTKVGKFIINN